MRDFSHLVFALMVLTGSVFAQDTETALPKIISTVPFVTPKVVEEAGIDGTLRVSVKIDKDGSVKDLNVLGGPSWPCGANPKREIEILIVAVRENLLLAKFTPAVKNNKPRSSEMVVRFAIGEAYQAELRRREIEDAKRRGIDPPLFLKGGIVNGRALLLPVPSLPSAIRSVMSGEPVIVEVEIGEDGRVARAGAISGELGLQFSSRTAACEAKFSPTYIEGKAARVKGSITYDFTKRRVP